MFLGHIYLGTIGMSGAYTAMRDGYVDEAWAQEHHELWYDDIQRRQDPGAAQPAAGRRRRRSRATSLSETRGVDA